MEFFKWKEVFNIGVEEIDRQHRIFLDLLNDCHERLSEGERRTVDRDMVAGLRKYATTHFRYEEGLMHSTEYPQSKNHAIEHRYFETQVSEMERGGAGGDPRTHESVLPFLRDWFLKHVLEHDRKIGHYLR